MASTMAEEFRNAPWTIASAGTGAIPMCVTSKPFEETWISTAFTDEEPMSSPTIGLVLFRKGSCTLSPPDSSYA